MRKCLLLPFLLFIAWLFFSLWYYTCVLRNRCSCDNSTSTKSVIASINTDATALQPLQWVNDGVVKATCATNFIFVDNQATIANPLDSNQIKFIKQLATYSKTNPDVLIRIDGVYINKEKDSIITGFENVGYARATFLKNKIIEIGGNAANFTTNDTLINAALSTYIYINGKTLSMAEGIKNNGFTIKLEGESFASGSSKFNPSQKFIADVDTLIRLQNQLTNKKIIITGHTDNTGKEDGNYKLGLARADAIRYFMVTRGVTLELSTDSKGSKMPVADNATTEGKLLNRRVEIIFN